MPPREYEPELRKICGEVQGHAIEIVGRWKELAWQDGLERIPKDYGIDHLRGVIAALARMSLCEPLTAEAATEELGRIARHGTTRCGEGRDEVLLFAEYHLLREAIAEWIRERYGREGAGLMAILRIDVAITLASRASLLGFHREKFEERGDWPAVLEKVAHDSPFLA